MKWFIQLDFMTEPSQNLIYALERNGIQWASVKVEPFSAMLKVNGELTNNAFFYGSTKMVRMAQELGTTPGVIADQSTFNVHAWDRFLGPSFMLNSYDKEWSLTPISKLHRLDRDVFVRPTHDLKPGNSAVHLKEDDWSNTLAKMFPQGVPKNSTLALSPLRNIRCEMRFFIVGRKIITHSMYKKAHSCVVTDDKIQLYDYVQACLDIGIWLPDETCVMDVVLVETGLGGGKLLPFILEFNCINAAGFYNCDLDKLVVAIQDHYKEQ